MTYRGRVENGTIVLDDSPVLPEGITVEVQITDDVSAAERPLSPLLKLAGKAVDLPPDASVNLDHYLYGHPKRD